MDRTNMTQVTEKQVYQPPQLSPLGSIQAFVLGQAGSGADGGPSGASLTGSAP